MSLFWSRLMAIGVAVVLVTTVRMLEASGLEYAFEDCAFAAVAAVVAGIVIAALPKS